MIVNNAVGQASGSWVGKHVRDVHKLEPKVLLTSEA